MTKAQKSRFMELKKLGSDMNEAQQDEFDKLAEVAVKSGLDLDTLSPVDQSALTEVELSNVIKGSVQDEIFGLREELTDKLEDSASKADLERIVKKYASEQLDQAELVEKIAGELPKGESLSKEDLTEAFTSAVQGIKVESSHQFPVEQKEMTIEIPFGDSVGNLTVSSKQLLNRLQGKAENADIPESMVKQAQVNGRKALSSATGGSDGGNMVNTYLSSAIEVRMFHASPVAALFQAGEIQMPTAAFEIPLVTARPEFAISGGENQSTTTADATFSKCTLNSKKFIGNTGYSYELDQDSVVAILPMLQEQLALSAAEALEQAIIQTGEQNKAGTAYAKAALFDAGLAGISLSSAGVVYAGSASDTGMTQATTDIPLARADMGVAGINPNELALILSPKAYGEIMRDSNVVTVDKIGDQATVRNGQLASIFGIPIFVSAKTGGVGKAAASADTAAASTLAEINAGNYVDPIGKINDSGETAADNDVARSGFLVNVNGLKMGVRGGFSIEVDRDIQKQTNIVVASFRRAFNVLDSSGANVVAQLVDKD